MVNTESVAINNTEATINFPSGLLEIVSVSKSGSIFSLWVEEPTFSNNAGTLSFNGGMPTPGFTGTTGKIIGVTFRVKKAGSASLVFSSAAVRANDGYGTNVYKTGAQALFNLVTDELPPTVPPTEIIGAPKATQISSLTHPNPEKWYSNNDPKFTWDVPSDITGTRLLIGILPTAVPNVFYSETISEKQLEDLADGIWYFHVQFRNKSGWGGVSHFKFQIDTEKPTRFEITEIGREDLTDPKAKFRFDAKDETSGIDHYEVQIDSGSPQVWKDSGNGIYETPTLGPAKHVLIAKAIDKAGNSLANSVEFVIEALDAPVITDYPSELASGEMLIVKGTTYPNAQVVLWLQGENDKPESHAIKSDDSGGFTFVAEEKLKDGIYRMWAEVVDERGARSEPTEKVTIAVERPAILKIGSWAVSLLAVVIPLAALIFVLFGVIYYGWHKLVTLRKRVKKEIREAEHALHKAFDLLKEAIREQIKMLEKTKSRRELTEEEEKIIKQLKKDLDDAEKFVRKEIEDIEKEVK